ncbi:hypothetical protein [Clostridium sp. Marseille-P299]|nr:hypothetical protein [Clostridium sp. Marseille-P299]
MDFLMGLAEYGIKYVLLLSLSVAGVFIGKILRDKKNAKKVVE